jgi:hypothetical protein
MINKYNYRNYRMKQDNATYTKILQQKLNIMFAYMRHTVKYSKNKKNDWRFQ